MLSWLSANLATVIICAILAAIITAVIIYMVRNRKKGRSSCECGCSNCPMSSGCHRKD